ncbi:metabolite traffic protein EboE [Stratiformator vulcanicus]|uniref:Xylose isomerase-like TIM barrel n=1 Tax=Stratiformator vulcanicus TaxID=2527980 RepID=A0A517R450_9PLAN|nr:metabolite traffic protein EboE [Stratiformator vulcanicus]QDT38646.1 Xylose isomerase-like TIM barrel [Stratiformator vulcanicus]
MSISTLPLAYCANVHPGRSVDEVVAGLRTYSSVISREVGGDLSVGLWLARPVATELLDDETAAASLRPVIDDAGLSCYTLNAFPFGDFHAERVKHDVYQPDWTTPERLQFTKDCARLLADLMPEGVEGSVSTVPLGYSENEPSPDFMATCRQQIIETAQFLDELHDETGRVVRLAIEPEPFCVLETTPQAVAFFGELFDSAGDAEAVVRQHIGLCYDVCHQAVEFEDITESIRAVAEAGIRLNKVQLSCAIRLEDPSNKQARDELAAFAEPKYLHQTFGAKSGRVVCRTDDLTSQLCHEPSPDFAEADEWRIHFHVPVDAQELGCLSTTRAQLNEALLAIDGLEYAPHLEIETYTWPVMNRAEAPAAEQSIISGIAREVIAVREQLSRQRAD